MTKQVTSTVLLILVYLFNYLGVNWLLWASQMQLAEIFPFPFMPPGITFMVAWTGIYILLLWYILYGRLWWVETKLYQDIQQRFWVSCLLNIFWIVATWQERYIISVAIIFWLWIVLAKILDIIHIEYKEKKNIKEFRGVVLPFGIYYWRISLASSIVAISQLVYQFNIDFTLGQIWTFIVIAIGVSISIYSRRQRNNIWQFIITIWALMWIAYALFL